MDVKYIIDCYEDSIVLMELVRTSDSEIKRKICQKVLVKNIYAMLYDVVGMDNLDNIGEYDGAAWYANLTCMVGDVVQEMEDNIDIYLKEWKRENKQQF